MENNGKESELVALLDKVINGNYNTYTQAAHTLKELYPTEAASQLATALLHNPNHPQFEQILNSIHIIHDTKVAPVLLEVFGRTSDEWQKYGLAELLGIFEEKEAIPLLIPLLTHPNYRLREVGARALGYIGENQSVVPLIKLLDNETHPYIISSTIEALGNISDPKTIPFLLAIVSDINSPFRHKIVEALDKFEMATIFGVIERIKDEEGEVLKVATILTMRFSDTAQTKQTLIDLLSDNSASIRANAAWVLGEKRVTKAADALYSLIDNLELGVVFSAGEALGKLGDERATQLLLKALNTPYIMLRIGVLNTVDSYMVLSALGSNDRKWIIETLQTFFETHNLQPTFPELQILNHLGVNIEMFK